MTKVFYGHNYFTYSQCKRIVRNSDEIKNFTELIAAAGGLTKSRAGGIAGFVAYVYGWSTIQKSQPFRTAVRKHKGLYIKYTMYLPPWGYAYYHSYTISYR